MNGQSIAFITISIVFIVFSFKIDIDSKKELFEYAEKNTFDVQDIIRGAVLENDCKKLRG